jgi:hypothetical protein
VSCWRRGSRLSDRLRGQPRERGIHLGNFENAEEKVNQVRDVSIVCGEVVTELLKVLKAGRVIVALLAEVVEDVDELEDAVMDERKVMALQPWGTIREASEAGKLSLSSSAPLGS